VKVDKSWKDKTTGEVTYNFLKGDKVEIFFSEKYQSKIFVAHNNEVKIASASNAHKWLTGFTPTPSMGTLERWSDNGIAKTVTGQKTEPDGYGSDGSPSWLLVLGMI
jgi:hypothetical protein